MNDEEAAFNEAIDASNGEGSSTQGAVGASNDAPTPGMSKNAIKKAAKLVSLRDRWDWTKLICSARRGTKQSNLSSGRQTRNGARSDNIS